MLTKNHGSQAKPTSSVSDALKALFCKQMRVQSPRADAQGALLCSARAESTDRHVKQVLLSFWQIVARQDWPFMGPFLALLALFLGLAWSVWFPVC